MGTHLSWVSKYHRRPRSEATIHTSHAFIIALSASGSAVRAAATPNQPTIYRNGLVAATAGATLSAESFALLKKAVASWDSPIMDYIGDSRQSRRRIDFARTLGISAYPAEQVVQRYDQRCQVTLSAIMLEAEGDVIEAAAAPPRLPQPHRLPSPADGHRPSNATTAALLAQRIA